MQIKINLLARDSVLAAPLVIELARLADLAHRRGERGVQQQLAEFFKAPFHHGDGAVEHGFPAQHQALLRWLANGGTVEA